MNPLRYVGMVKFERYKVNKMGEAVGNPTGIGYMIITPEFNDDGAISNSVISLREKDKLEDILNQLKIDKFSSIHCGFFTPDLIQANVLSNGSLTIEDEDSSDHTYIIRTLGEEELEIIGRMNSLRLPSPTHFSTSSIN